MTEALLLFAVLAIPAAILAIKYWPEAIFGVFVLLIFEGALRKWVFPWAQAQIYLLKDVILFAAYIGFLSNGPRVRDRFPELSCVKALLSISLIFSFLQIFNPNSPSILVGLVGFKIHFLYVPLLFVLPYTFSSKEQLSVIIKRYLILAIPIAILGFVQSALGPGSSLNVYVSSTEDPAALVRFGRDEDLVRTSGTFSYISGYTTYLSFMALLSIGYNLANRWEIKNNLVGLGALTLVVGAMFTTGSRAPVYVVLVTTPIIITWALYTRVMAGQTAIRLIIILPLIGVAALSIRPHAFEAFIERVNAPEADDAGGRLSDTLAQTIEAITESPPLGYGIGTTHPSSLTVMGVQWPWWLGDRWYEVEAARVAEELGIIGLLFVYGGRILLVVCAFRCTMSFRDQKHRAFGIVLTLYLALGLFFPVIFDATAGLYYWGAAGIVLAMRRFESQKYIVRVSDLRMGRALLPASKL